MSQASNKAIILPESISEGTVVKFNLKPKDNENARALHFIPPFSAIKEHTHTRDSEIYFILCVTKTEKNEKTSYECSWKRFGEIAIPNTPSDAHSVKSDQTDFQIIYGVKKGPSAENWTEEAIQESIPKIKVSYIEYDSQKYNPQTNPKISLWRFNIEDENLTLYADQTLEHLISKDTSTSEPKYSSYNLNRTTKTYTENPIPADIPLDEIFIIGQTELEY